LPGKIAVDGRIGFAGSKGGSPGKAVLKESAARDVGLVSLVMKGHTEIKKLRIEVRAEGVSKNETQARADAIKEALVAKGVEVDRIEAVGMGAGGSRVDFLIVQTAAAPKPAGPAGDAEAPQSP
jgi:ribosomal protein S11